jgi:hypothetical protein
MQHDLRERSTRSSLHDAPDILGGSVAGLAHRAMLAFDFEANKTLALDFDEANDTANVDRTHRRMPADHKVPLQETAAYSSASHASWPHLDSKL